MTLEDLVESAVVAALGSHYNPHWTLLAWHLVSKWVVLHCCGLAALWWRWWR